MDSWISQHTRDQPGQDIDQHVSEQLEVLIGDTDFLSHLGERLALELLDVLAANLDQPIGRVFHVAQELQESGLACTAHAGEEKHLTIGNRHRDIGECFYIGGVGFTDLDHFDHGAV